MSRHHKSCNMALLVFYGERQTGEHFVIQHTFFQCALRERSNFIYCRVAIVKQTGDDSTLNHINNTTREMRQREKVLGRYKLIIITAVANRLRLVCIINETACARSLARHCSHCYRKY